MAISIGESANVRLNFDDIEKSGKALAGLEQSLKNIVLEVNKVTQGFADGNWGEVFLGLISGAGTSLLGIVAIKAAFDGLATIIPVIVSGLGGIVTSLSGFIVPIALATAAIAALVAGIMYLWQTNETFRNGVIQAWEAIKTTMETVVATIVTFVSEKLAQIKAFWDEHGAAVMQAVTNIFNGIKSIIEPVMNGILAIMQFVWPFIVSLIQMVWGNIQGVISGALNIIMGLVKAFAGLFTGDFSLMWEGIKQLFLARLKRYGTSFSCYCLGGF